MNSVELERPYVVRVARFCSGLVTAFGIMGLLGTLIGFFALSSNPETYGERWFVFGGLVPIIPILGIGTWLFVIQKTRKKIAWYATIVGCILYFGIPAIYILCNWFKPEVKKWYNV